MQKLFIPLLVGVLASVSTPALAKHHDNSDQLGKGDYFVFVFPGIDAQHPVRMTTVEFDVLKSFDTVCRDESKRQRPPELKVVFLNGIRQLPGAIVGGVAGSLASGFAPSLKSAGNYGLYNGIASAGGGIGAGFTINAMGKMSTLGGCMSGMLNRAHQMGYLKNIIITYNTFGARGHPIHRSSLPAPTAAELQAATPASARDSSGDSDSDNAPAPPPHG